jgi:hypothetical protein
MGDGLSAQWLVRVESMLDGVHGSGLDQRFVF